MPDFALFPSADPGADPSADWIDTAASQEPGAKLPASMQRFSEPRNQPFDNGRAFIAVSPAMREVRRQIEQLAAIDAAVLLVGECGTGKEAAARLIHKLSSRSSCPFLNMNCAASPGELLESDLFGHEASGTAARAGKLEAAHKGTLLLDDIAGMPQPAQAKLLQFLQEGEFSRRGSRAAIQADVRVLAAAEGDLRPVLRPDLYYRLNVFSLSLPPLRERREDLPHLLDHFIAVWAEAYGRPRLPVTRRILDACAAHPWPGNLRELENFVRRYLVLGDEKQALDQIAAAPQASASAAPGAGAVEGACDLKSVVRGLKRDAERTAIASALERTGGNKQEAAGLLHISLRALHYKVRAYHIESPQVRAQAGAGSGEALTLPRAVGDNTPYERPRSRGGKLIPMHRAPSGIR